MYDGEKQAGITRRFSLVPSKVSRLISYFNEILHLETIPKSGRKRNTNVYAAGLKGISLKDLWKSGDLIKAKLLKED